ncbi:MAG: hypothetical protein FWE31_02500 [Firmicutes bacterium]|nr:hypothetical protein [Bacillota bacterium]
MENNGTPLVPYIYKGNDGKLYNENGPISSNDQAGTVELLRQATEGLNPDQILEIMAKYGFGPSLIDEFKQQQHPSPLHQDKSLYKLHKYTPKKCLTKDGKYVKSRAEGSFSNLRHAVKAEILKELGSGKSATLGLDVDPRYGSTITSFYESKISQNWNNCISVQHIEKLTESPTFKPKVEQSLIDQRLAKVLIGDDWDNFGIVLSPSTGIAYINQIDAYIGERRYPEDIFLATFLNTIAPQIIQDYSNTYEDFMEKMHTVKDKLKTLTNITHVYEDAKKLGAKHFAASGMDEKSIVDLSKLIHDTTLERMKLIEKGYDGKQQ